MQFDRRQLLLGGIGTAAGLMLPGRAMAQSPASIGTFPDGVSADSVFARARLAGCAGVSEASLPVWLIDASGYAIIDSIDGGWVPCLV